MFTVYDPVVWGMAGMRFLSSGIELTAAVLMIHFGTAENALKINAVLSIVGPAVLLTVMLLGICGLAGQLSVLGFISILAGVALIFFGINQLR